MRLFTVAVVLSGCAALYIIAAVYQRFGLSLDKSVRPVDVVTLAAAIFVAFFLQDFLASRAVDARAEKDLLIKDTTDAIQELKKCEGLVASFREAPQIKIAKQITSQLRYLSNTLREIETAAGMSKLCNKIEKSSLIQYLGYKQAVTGGSFPSKAYTKIQITDQNRAYRALLEKLHSLVFQINRSRS